MSRTMRVGQLGGVGRSVLFVVTVASVAWALSRADLPGLGRAGHVVVAMGVVALASYLLTFLAWPRWSGRRLGGRRVAPELLEHTISYTEDEIVTG